MPRASVLSRQYREGGICTDFVKAFADGAAAFFATGFFALSLRAPKRSVLPSAALGLVGQVIFTLLSQIYSMNLAVFVAAFVICLISEFLTRPLKAPVTLISFPAVIPLVPGVMLYKTMLTVASGDYQKGAQQIVEVLVFSFSMAIAITAAALFAKIFMKKKKIKPAADGEKTE